MGLLYVFSTPLDVVSTPVGTPARLAGMFFLAVWGLNWLSGTTRPPRAIAVYAALAALVFWQAATVSWSYAPEISTSQAITSATLALSAIAVASSLAIQLVWPAFAMALGGALAGGLALASGPGEVYQDGLALASEQATFLGIDQNILSFHLCLGMASALFLVLRGWNAWVRLTSVSMATILFVAIVVVGSRTGIGATIAMIALTAVAFTRSFARVLVAVTVALAFAQLVRYLIAAGMVPNRVVQWVENPVVTDSRSEIVDAYWATRSDWLTKGVGAGADADYLYLAASWYKNAHSAFWRIWIESGLVGLAIWAFLLFGLAQRAWRSTQRLFFLLTLPPIVAFFYTLGPLNSNMLWVVFGLALGAHPRTVLGDAGQKPDGGMHGKARAFRRSRMSPGHQSRRSRAHARGTRRPDVITSRSKG